MSALSHAAYRAALNNAEQTIASCVNALRSLAFGLPDREAEEPAGLALAISERLSPYDLRDLLLSWWPPRLANSGLFAVRALSVLAHPEFADYFNMRDYRVQAALLACPYGTSLQPLDSFVPAADLHLPDHPWPALEIVEVLQRTGRWDDVAEIARHIHAAIPGAPDHQARADLTRDHRGTRRRGDPPEHRDITCRPRDTSARRLPSGANLVVGLALRLRGLSRFDRTERLAAAHRVIVLAGFFESLSGADLPADVGKLLRGRAAQVAATTGAGVSSDRLSALAGILQESDVPGDPLWPGAQDDPGGLVKCYRSLASTDTRPAVGTVPAEPSASADLEG